ncbi:ExbD/TolR family protein [Celeribacter ethanolicus]|uniref:Biopolymer transporter ExbD n=1 Tax=Celeribacter ethanolicus TaxID=1758178 RepID=A0A291GF31_9RHOB|nr:biopolymer transporter ExbD [Celeribacter ethanolicus]ATG48616.1 biopolymer transporter ExbD [Celeribacter ethanolicus]TNE68117.1 MAG: biopolymer transporter ExbD [Paracoccaceae bacterium]
MEFGAPRRKHRMSLTPMIDVVFLLLVFFMLASRFGSPAQLSLTLGGGAAQGYSGPPRLVRVGAEELKLNGAVEDEEALVARLQELVDSPEDIVVLRPDDAEVPLQRLVSVMEWLGEAGFTNLVLVE